MKIVINSCFGGFSLSRKAVQRLAELQGRECYFFEHKYVNNEYVPISDPFSETARRYTFWTTFDVPDPNAFEDEKELYDKHYINNRPDDRTDPLLVQVVEELGDEANGDCAKLRIVEVPDGIEWEIDEYDGVEHIAEKHRTWY